VPGAPEHNQLQTPTIIHQLKPGLRIDLLRREIWQTLDDGLETSQRRSVIRLSLTPTEGKLMQVFAENIGKVIPHKELVTYVQGTDTAEMEAPEILRPFISRLRRKLGVFPHGRAWIRSIRGTGYMFDPELEK
jgi:DNA-binding response OmpR family regulator